MVSKQSRSWPPGRAPLPQRFRDEYKRERCALAVAEVVREYGPHSLTVGLVTGQAAMARATFYELFEGREEAWRWACDYSTKRLCDVVGEASQASCTPLERLEAIVPALLEFTRENRSLAELSLVHCGAFSRGDEAPSVETLVETIAVLLDGTELATDQRRISLGEFLARSVVSVISTHLIQSADSFERLDRDLVKALAAPFLELPETATAS